MKLRSVATFLLTLSPLVPNWAQETPATHQGAPTSRFPPSKSSLKQRDSSACPSPGKDQYEEVFEIAKDLTSTQPLCQGSYGSCYAMAAKNILESIYRSKSSADKKLNLSAVSILAEGNGRQIRRANGGNISVALQRIRLNDYRVFLDDPDPKSDLVSDYDRIVRAHLIEGEELVPSNRRLDQLDPAVQMIANHQTKEFEAWVQANGSPGLKSFLKNTRNREWYAEHLKKCSENKYTCLYEALYHPKFVKQVQLDPFNIYTVTLPRDDEGFKGSSSQIKKLVESGAVIGVSAAGHAVSIQGRRKVCCEVPGKSGEISKKENCEIELKIFDSMSDEQSENHWFLESSLAEKMPDRLTYVRPCQPSGAAAHKPKLELCVPHLQGEDAVLDSLWAGDVDYIRSLIESNKLKVDQELFPSIYTPLKIALKSDNAQLAKLLLDNGATLGNSRASLAAEAAYEGSVGVLELLKERKINLKEVGHDGTSALVNAVSSTDSHLGVVKFLQENGGDLKQKDRYGDSLLHLSVYRSADIETVRYLLDDLKTPNVLNDNGETPLFKAIFYSSLDRRTDVVQLLCERGADPTIKNAQGKTALDQAIEQGYAPIIELLKNGCIRR